MTTLFTSSRRIRKLTHDPAKLCLRLVDWRKIFALAQMVSMEMATCKIEMTYSRLMTALTYDRCVLPYWTSTNTNKPNTFNNN